MKGASDYAVVYDISSDAERARVDKTLKGFGFRIQKSVFECRLTKKGRDDLVCKLKELEIKTGFIKVYRLEYSFKNPVIGVAKKADLDEGNAFIV
ncbi:MAG TPA: CRISPR-associated endonuclease Cas2 [Syntrophorhabdus sp.]|jgi:CRISPR-associated protein Cas2|nr:CRISPR-associated endonuclease Cas2 [Syntrophorhabdus sp.]HQM27056.1 CRISPR-associated endonuclease Cas2 [Syntrophorhabdus sp.]